MDIQNISVPDLVKVDGYPLILYVNDKVHRANKWVEKNKSIINRLVEENGALVIRGLKIHGSKQFGEILSSIFGGELLEYIYRSTPRKEIRGHIYTSTEYPAGEIIPQHNENAYSQSWPNRLGFLCLVEPRVGGETPIGSNENIYNDLPTEIRKQFDEKKLCMCVIIQILIYLGKKLFKPIIRRMLRCIVIEMKSNLNGGRLV